MLLAAAAVSATLFALPPGLTEVSGCAYGASGTLYVHEDSGAGPIVTALTPTGKVKARYDLGVDARDWEDMAAGPGGTLLLADIGDNSGIRSQGVLIHRIAEPSGSSKRVRPSSFRLTYEDQPQDAETLLVHPRTGQVLVVTKAILGQGVYAAPQPLAAGTLRKVADVTTNSTGTPGGPVIGAVSQRLVTGGAVSPDGTRLVLRTYTDAYVYDVPGDDLIKAFDSAPQVIALPESHQGEAITWAPDGASLVVTGEGSGALVSRVRLPGKATAPAKATATAPRTSRPVTATPSQSQSQSHRDRTPWVVGGVGGLVLLLALARRASRRPDTR